MYIIRVPLSQDETVNKKKRVWETLFYDLDLIESGRQDSNLRPSAPKTLSPL